MSGKESDKEEFNLICLALKVIYLPFRLGTIFLRRQHCEQCGGKADRQRECRTENWDARGLKLRLKWKLLLLTNWWVSAVWETSASRCICLPRLSVSCSIVVFFLSMPDLQLHPHGPNDNAAGKKEASWRERSEWKDPKSQLSLPPFLLFPFTLFPLLLMSAGLDSPGEIKPVCNAALPLHVCVFTTWPHRCGARLHSSVCGRRLSPLNHMQRGEEGSLGLAGLSLADSFSRGLVLRPYADKWQAINRNQPLPLPTLPPPLHLHMVHYKHFQPRRAVPLSSDGLLALWLAWNDIFLFRAVRGPCFFFVHARVPFKRGNLRKGTPSHRSQDLYLWGWWAGRSNHGTPSMKTAWLIMGTVWVVQSTRWWHLVTHVSVLIDFNPWNIRTVGPLFWWRFMFWSCGNQQHLV